MKRKFFITGLCMQGNKGGPAIALSLTRAIKQHIPTAEFVFSVPATEYALEKIWAEKYGFEIVRNIDLKHLIPPFIFTKGRMKRLFHWIEALRNSEAMIQMSAISYVGPPSANPKLRTLLSGRFMDFYMSNLLNRRMLAWTQSYGPLTTKCIRFIAKIDLKSQPIIFCRGNDCLEEVRELLPLKPMLSYPDIAVTLEYSSIWARQYLSEKNMPSEDFVSLSPSAVMYSKSHNRNGLNKHIETLKKICDDLISKNIKIILVPHTYRPGRPDANVCDYATSVELLKHIENQEYIYLIKDDLSATELKSVISLALAHIGGRYHSVVAALSSGVPTLSLSWHPKYKDVMREYGVSEFVIETYEENLSRSLLDKLLENRNEISSNIHEIHEEVIKNSQMNIGQFISVLEGNE